MSKIAAILASGLSMRDESVVGVSERETRDAEVRLGFLFPQSYVEFTALGGLAELRFNHRILRPSEIVERQQSVDSARYVPFAENGCGDLYCWPRTDEAEPTVLFLDHESNGCAVVAESFVDWLTKNRF